MYSVIIYYWTKPGQTEKLIQSWNRLAEISQTMKGCQGIHFLSNPRTRRCIGIGYWDSEEDADAFVHSDPYRRFMAEVMDYLDEEPVREIYDFHAGPPRETMLRAS